MESLLCTPQPTLSHELRMVINQRNILTAKSKAKIINDLDKEIEESKISRQSRLRDKVIEEIFTSEVSYLKQLEIIMKYFKEPLDSSNLMTMATRRALFGNIESIYRVNGELVNQLKQNGNNVGAAFLYLAPFFKLYSMYAYDYKNALSLLEKLRTQVCELSRWLRAQERRPEVGCSLGALLITPIQRMPRYRLLLRQLLGLTASDHPHHACLVEAVKEVEEATAHINSLVSEQEVNSRLVTLQHCLVDNKPCLVTHNRKLLKEGVLMKMSANGQKAQRRYFVLLSDSIVYCKLTKSGDSQGQDQLPADPGSLQCCCVLPLNKCSVETVLGQGVFNLTCRNETYILFSQHKDDAADWVESIKKAIEQHQENVKTLLKKSSSRYPLHLTRKRKLFNNKENDHAKNGSPAKKARTSHPNTQHKEEEEKKKIKGTSQSNPSQQLVGEIRRPNYVQTIKSLFQSFGDSVRQYLFPGNCS